MAYTEAFFATSAPSDGDVEWIELDGWTIESRCPHQNADLARMGSVCDGVLTCGLHGWKFDLATGESLTTAGATIRVRRD
jgi:UDP-MurNAc hydroxylase